MLKSLNQLAWIYFQAEMINILNLMIIKLTDISIAMNVNIIPIRESKNGKEYCIATKTNFGKMSKVEKLNAIANEYNKAISKFEDNKDSIKEAFESLGYGTGEALFNIAQNGSVEEFIGNYLLSNIETIGDFAQYDLDGVNILMDMRYLEKKYDFVQKNY